WEFVVSTYQSGEVTITWERIFETTPPGYEFELVDGESGQVINPRILIFYTYHSEGNRTFTLNVNSSLSAVNPIPLAMLTEFALNSIYPNPFNNFAIVEYSLPYATSASILIYDTNGNLIGQAGIEMHSAGYFVYKINGNDLGVGNYFVKMVASE
ncbi:MAG: T9SS type A sorting domain-containing protein, partial [Calditrichaeota bacterium]|nr:T9SS type A sorting domain-containing protein [Calditrichota bacterium]